jgi:preprotein translocase subunit YajC
VKELASLLPLVAIFGIFWLLVLRPASRRNKELAQIQHGVAAGDRVMLSSGFYGTIHSIEDDLVQFELAPGMVTQVARGAIARVVAESQPAITEES